MPKFSKHEQRFFAAIAISLIVAFMNSPFGCGMLFAVIMFGTSRALTKEAREHMEYILPQGINVDVNTPEHVAGTYERAQKLVEYMKENFE